METTDEQLQMLLKERNELQAKQIEKDVKGDKRSMDKLRQSVIWMRAVNKYRKPLESMNQLSKRAGFLKENKAFQWFKRDSVPHANRIVPILVNLGATEEDANEVFKDMYGVPDISETAVSIAEGYVYPNHNGVDDAEGRLGFKNVFLETNNIKPEAVKLVICDTQAMEPFIRQRDMLLVDMSKTTPQSGKIYLLELTDEPDQQIVSKVAVIPGRRYNIIFENKEIMNSYAVDQDGVLIHGEVVFVGRLL